jgi:hypothetical protein
MIGAIHESHAMIFILNYESQNLASIFVMFVQVDVSVLRSDTIYTI